MGPIDNIFYQSNLVARDDTLDAIYRALRMRDEQEVVRLLDAHRKEHGEPEQIAYAARNEHRQDDAALGHFPYQGATGWSPTDLSGRHLVPKSGQGEPVPVQRQSRRL